MAFGATCLADLNREVSPAVACHQALAKQCRSSRGTTLISAARIAVALLSGILLVSLSRNRRPDRPRRCPDCRLFLRGRWRESCCSGCCVQARCCSSRDQLVPFTVRVGRLLRAGAGAGAGAHYILVGLVLRRGSPAAGSEHVESPVALAIALTAAGKHVTAQLWCFCRRHRDHPDQVIISVRLLAERSASAVRVRPMSSGGSRRV